MKQALETFVATGGGLVNTQATFPGYLNWPAFETTDSRIVCAVASAQNKANASKPESLRITVVLRK